MTRSMLKQAKMPSGFWGEVIRNSVYLLNKLPARALSNKTPYEVFNETKPSVGHIRVFGCLAHVKVPSVQLSKLDDRSKAMVHLGREPGTKGYRLYDPASKMIQVSRDIVFEKDKGWTWSEQKNEAAGKTEFTVVLGNDDLNSEDAGNTQTQDGGNNTRGETVTPITRRRMADTSDESAPRKCRPLSEVYDDTEEVKYDEELMLMGIEEPTSYRQAVKEKE